MIVIYAQSASQQGLDIAVNGIKSDSNDERFIKMRAMSARLNLKNEFNQESDLEINQNGKLVRFEIMGAEANAEDLSPIIIAIETSELLKNPDNIADIALKSVAAIGRKINGTLINIALAEAYKYANDKRKKQIIFTLFGSVAIVGLLVWVYKTV